LLAFRVFRHLREEAGELDVIACDRVRREYFATFDIGEVFARGTVLHFEIPCRDVADFVSVRCGIYFELVIFNGWFHIACVNWYAAQALLQNLIMQTTGICYDRSFAFRVGECSEHKSWNVGQYYAA